MLKEPRNYNNKNDNICYNNVNVLNKNNFDSIKNERNLNKL